VVTHHDHPGGDRAGIPSGLTNGASMSATGTFRLPSATARLAGELRRAVVACGITFAFCLSAVLIANHWRASMSQATRTLPSSEADLSSGAMLVVPPSGTFCRLRTIDNSTWQIRDNGWVDCDDALAKAANSGTPPGSRIDLIREGFRGKQ
jgi:hypothetical protein